MVAAVAHRGPDASRVVAAGRHALGAARLAIFGGAAAEQPWRAEGLTIVFNGEIYNYVELAEEVGLPATDAERSEPQLLARLYRMHGSAFPARLSGMYALAILDSPRDRLVLARDPFGIKPLYLAERHGELAFASEIKALLGLPWVDADIDEADLAGLATFGYVIGSDRTLFRGVRQLPPGAVASFDAGGLEVRTHYTLPPVQRLACADPSAGLAEAAADLRARLDAAVGAQCQHGEQPKALYLSGGVDSSLLLGIAARRSDHPIVAYTLAGDDASEDLRYARWVASAVGVEHRVVRVDAPTCIDCLPDYIHHYEHALAGGVFDIHGGLAFHLLSREISREFRVAFSGEGADELFAGYYWAFSHPLRFAERIRSRLARVPDAPLVAEAVAALFPEPADAWLYRENLCDWLMRGGLANYHLCCADRAAGAFGLEVRPPFLDARFADAALRLPLEWKVGKDGGQTKHVLRETARPLFQELGIEDVLTRQKLGMPWAVRALAPAIDAWAEGRITVGHQRSHPFRRFLTGALETALFDLFFAIFVRNRGQWDEEIDADEFFASGANVRQYG